MSELAVTQARSMTAARLLVPAVAVLMLVDLVGGVWAATSGVNTWGEAWGSRALLAAPVPMMVAQVVLAIVAARSAGRAAVGAAGLLALACLVSVISGFFDGGIGNDRLTPAMAGFQAFLLAVTGTVGVLALARLRDLWRGGAAATG